MHRCVHELIEDSHLENSVTNFGNIGLINVGDPQIESGIHSQPLSSNITGAKAPRKIKGFHIIIVVDLYVAAFHLR